MSKPKYSSEFKIMIVEAYLNGESGFQWIANTYEVGIASVKLLDYFLDYLLAEEAETKNNRVVENQIKMSGFPYRKTLEQFDFQPSINKEQIMELATMRFVENKENVVFLGTPGVGNTPLAVFFAIIAA